MSKFDTWNTLRRPIKMNCGNCVHGHYHHCVYSETCSAPHIGRIEGDIVSPQESRPGRNYYEHGYPEKPSRDGMATFAGWAK